MRCRYTFICIRSGSNVQVYFRNSSCAPVGAITRMYSYQGDTATSGPLQTKYVDRWNGASPS